MSDDAGRSIRLFRYHYDAYLWKLHLVKSKVIGNCDVENKTLGNGSLRYFLSLQSNARRKFLCEDGEWRLKEDCIITDAAKGPIF